MATGQDSAGAPTPEAAARALPEAEARRRLVEAEHWRHVSFELAVWSAVLVLDYAAKDVFPSRRRRLAATALCQLAGAAVLALNPRRVRGPDRPRSPGDVGAHRGPAVDRLRGDDLIEWVAPYRAGADPRICAGIPGQWLSG
jgi:hypothetical protein